MSAAAVEHGDERPASSVNRDEVLRQVRRDTEQAFDLLQRSLEYLEDAGMDRLAEPACEAANWALTFLEAVQREPREASGLRVVR